MGYPGKPVWEKSEKVLAEGLGTPDWRKRTGDQKRARRVRGKEEPEEKFFARFAGRARKAEKDG